MQIALEREDYAFIRFLIGSGVNINYNFSENLRPLEYALHTSNKSLAEFLIKNGAATKQMDLGCVFDIEMLKYFIRRGADATTIKIDCALHDQNLAQQLISLNPKFKGNNLSSYSFDELLAQPKLLDFLFANGFSVNAINNDIEKRTLLSLAAEANNEAATEILLRHGAAINQKDDAGITPLFYAAMNNHLDLAKRLIEAGANINLTLEGTTSQSPLSIAFKNKNKALMRLLLKNGADLHITQDDFLATAVQEKDTNLIAILIDYGASAERLVNLFGSDYLFQNPKMFEFVLSKGGMLKDSNLMFRAIKEGKNDIAQALIHHQTGLSQTDVDGKSPLFYAFEQKNYALVYQLLDGGASPNHALEGYEPFLHIAIQQRNLILMHKLLQNDANINALNPAGVSALHQRYLSNTIRRQKFCFKNQATIQCEDLFLAIKNEHFSMVKILVENDADLTCTKDGKSIVKYAKKENLSYQIEQYLKGKIK